MTIIEEKIKNNENIGLLVFYCGECNTEILIPHYSKTPSLFCECKKPMQISDSLVVKIRKINESDN